MMSEKEGMTKFEFRIAYKLRASFHQMSYSGTKLSCLVIIMTVLPIEVEGVSPRVLIWTIKM